MNEKLLNKIQCKLDDHPEMKKLADHHLDSFNYAMNDVLKKIPKYLRPLEIKSNDKCKDIFKTLMISFEDLTLGKPVIDTNLVLSNNDNILYPADCREREINYSAPLMATIKRRFDTEYPESITIKLGNIPVMVKSDFCNLKNLDIKETVKKKEECNDFGAYFIINGIEKLIRMIVINRRNYPIGFIQPSSAKKMANCSEFLVSMKCVREDLVSQTINLHYLNDGNNILRITIRKQELMIPTILLLKCLVDCPDIYIFNRIVRGNMKNSKLRDCIEVFIAEGKKFGLQNQKQNFEYLGNRVRELIGFANNHDITDEEIGNVFIREYLCIHLEKNSDKFNVLCLMIEKLYLLAFGEIKPDNLDSPLNHEILLSGHLYLMVLRERLEDLYSLLKLRINKALSKVSEIAKIKDINYIRKLIESQVSIGKKMEFFLATGNLISRAGLDLKQTTGYSIAAEKLNNMRYISHFRSVHRGQFFTEMKTTTPRKLLPESWGFMCPVHTPDGSPCGLLNHITSGCHIISSPQTLNFVEIEKTLATLGMIPNASDLNLHFGNNSYPVVLDGKLLGYIEDLLVTNFINGLRQFKVFGQNHIPKTMEIGFIPKSTYSTGLQYPGLFLFTCVARMTRLVKNLHLNSVEYIGPLEQIYLEIACLPEDIRPDTTHQEIDPINMLSLVASMTPFCDYNQSPRNMYQCQMAKQTMGTPFFNYPYRMDNKIYRILNPQIPMVCTKSYDDYGFDKYPSGTNAVVAVLSYTGYDLEDAMIINKSAYERGFGHGLVYKTNTKRLNEGLSRSNIKYTRYRLLDRKNNKEDKKLLIPNHISDDGTPMIGTQLVKGMPEFIYFDKNKNQTVTNFYKDSEASIIDEIKVFEGETSGEICITFKYRFRRNPVIGDKFSSRHGQKGVLSTLWPQENMPFTENGICPDIIINPHAFPSRMTIGMLIESLAGKTGALKGKFHAISAFQQCEDDDIIGHFGKELLGCGFNSHGNEIMYSGVSGQQMKAEIFIGTVYYQRLRHMVNDKAQARSTGPTDILTRQPVKGRKHHGGIRFGEMERDGLLAHGVSFCLKERLFNSSDYSEGYICRKCGELLSILNYKEVAKIKSQKIMGEEAKAVEGVSEKDKEIIMINQGVVCRNCKEDNTCVKIALPYVLRYLTNELAAMNIKLRFALK